MVSGPCSPPRPSPVLLATVAGGEGGAVRVEGEDEEGEETACCSSLACCWWWARLKDWAATLSGCRATGGKGRAGDNAPGGPGRSPSRLPYNV